MDADIAKLSEIHPDLWQKAQVHSSKMFQNFDPHAIAEQVKKMKQNEMDTLRSIQKLPQQGAAKREAAEKLIEIRMTLYSIHRKLYDVLTDQRLPTLSKRDEKIAQWLFFTRNFERKDVSSLWFPMLWRLILDKKGVISALKIRGIYCVFSHQLGLSLKNIINSRSCIEIGAGDGSLTLLLEKSGATLAASDDRSWHHRIQYPDWVEPLDAASALKKYNPKVVICSWPPPDNFFERQILNYASVETYIAIGSLHSFGSGDRKTYEQGYGFKMENRPDLSKLIFPHEIGNEVLIFNRETNVI